MFKSLLIFLMTGLLSVNSLAEIASVETESGLEVPVTTQISDGTLQLMWFPSEYGYRPNHANQAQNLADNGISTQIFDLHSAYFEPTGKESIANFEIEDVIELIQSQNDAEKPLVLLSSGRGAIYLLEAVREMQLQQTLPANFIGVVLLHPYLYAQRPEPGADAQYLPITQATNIPLYVLQPAYSSKFWRMGGLAKAMPQATLYLQQLAKIQDGFAVRTDDGMDALNQAMQKNLPQLLTQAAKQLQNHSLPSQAATLPTGPDLAKPQLATGFSPLPDNTLPPKLAMHSLRQGALDLADYRGKVVIVSFWASWCPPCVEEIPSLNELYADYRAQDLEILSVSIGETAQEMESFLLKHPVDFPILMDEHGVSVADWKVYAYPTNLLVDRQGHLRYGRFGGLDWASSEVQNTLQQLLKEKM